MLELKIIIWNVAHGLAVTLITPNQRLIAYDAGRSEDLSPLTELERAGWKQLDYFFLSHPHADHLRDIDALIRMSPRTVRRPRPPERQIREAANGALEEGVVDRYEREIDQTYVQPSPRTRRTPAGAAAATSPSSSRQNTPT